MNKIDIITSKMFYKISPAIMVHETRTKLLALLTKYQSTIRDLYHWYL